MVMRLVFRLGATAAAVFLLLVPALWNGFPFLFFDTGGYLARPFDGTLAAGRSVVYERVEDYWGRALPVNIGRDNFAEIRYEFFRDPTVALEAFKADQMDWRAEYSAKNWATAYDFPAVRENRVVLEEFPVRSMGIMQGFAFNTRRDKFKDARVRRAFNYAFDFEEMNKQLFFGQYKRIIGINFAFGAGSQLASLPLPGESACKYRSTDPSALVTNLLRALSV